MQTPHHKCDWETRMTTDRKTILDYNINYLTYNYNEIPSDKSLLYSLRIVVVYTLTSRGYKRSLNLRW